MKKSKPEVVERLAQYFQIRNKNKEDIIEPIYQALVNNVGLDLNKFNACLESLNSDRENGRNLAFRTNHNLIDVSSKMANVYVKGVFENNRPILFFCDKNGNIFYKIKYSTKNGQKALVAETSINEYSVTPEFLKTLPTNENFYSHNKKVVFDENDNVIVRNRTFAKTGAMDSTVDEKDMCDEYKNFYLFLKEAMSKNGVASLDNLSVLKHDFVFSSFYQNLKDLCKTQDEFSFPEIVYLMNAVLNENTNIVSPLEADQTIAKGKYTMPVIELANVFASSKDKNKGTFEIGEGEQKRIIKFSCSDKFASIHILNNNNAEIVSYLINSSDKGFTLFKSIKNENLIGKDDHLRIFTLNLSDSLLRINASASINNREGGNSLESDLEVLKDGEIVLINTKTQEKENAMANNPTGKQLS